MSHLVCYTRRSQKIKIMKNKNENTNELTFRGWHSDEDETFTGVRNDSFGNDCRDHDQDAWNFEIDETQKSNGFFQGNFDKIPTITEPVYNYGTKIEKES